jgi:hypothetical protein
LGGFPLIFFHRGIIRADPQHPRAILPDFCCRSAILQAILSNS